MLDSLAVSFDRINSYLIYSRIKLKQRIDLHHYRRCCYEMCQEILDKVKNIQMQDPNFCCDGVQAGCNRSDRTSSPLICAVKTDKGMIFVSIYLIII